MEFQLWLLLFLPLGAAGVNFLFFGKNGFLASCISTIAVAGMFALTLLLLNKNATAEFSWAAVGSIDIKIGILLDELSSRMMLIVTGIGLLVHVFSLAYMREDEGRARYFTGLSLFMFSMAGIVLSDNFLMMFMFWELVGLSSYLLIGHWYQKNAAADAAKKAFLTNRIGDFGFMIGILLLWGISAQFTFSELHTWAQHATVPSGLMGIAILCIFCGAMGKSAQVPLHVWLPDAMEGPTPVSALIHAATMVAAGVYMMARLFLTLEIDGGHGGESISLIPAFSATIIAWIGAITALMAALMATQQDDIKKILAYSTLSQLGYMILAIGCLSESAAMFHLYTHAWFKGLLFLGSGAIIYACHHEQNIWKMGGLLKRMPITSVTFLIGTAALIAIPGTSGFWSKEQILVEARGTHPALFWIAVGTAALTTFYMLRLCFVVFLGKPRREGSEKAKEVGPLMFVPLLLLAVLAVIAGQSFIAEKVAPQYHRHPVNFQGLEFQVSLGALFIGVLLAIIFYLREKSDPLASIKVFRVFRKKFYVDEFYAQLVKYLQDGVAAVVHFFDEFIINGLFVGGLSRAVGGVGNLFRKMQSGNLQGYAVLFGAGILVLIYLTVFVK